jgi:hypothetical protein
LKDDISLFFNTWPSSAFFEQNVLLDFLIFFTVLGTAKVTDLVNAILYRLFLPLLHLLPSFDFAFSDFVPIHSDVLSSSSLFASRLLDYARPSPQDLLPFSESNPLFLSFLNSYPEAFTTAKKLGLSDDNAMYLFRMMRGVVKAEAEAKPSEEALFEAILDAVLSWKEMTRENARKEP